MSISIFGNDSRVHQNNRKEVIMKDGEYWAQVYCISCGHKGGMARNLSYIVYLCSNSDAERSCSCNCAKKYGGLPMLEVPYEVMTGKKEV